MISKTLISFITSWIIENTEFAEKVAPPEFFILSESEMSEKACFSSDNCRVKAYYVKNEGIFLEIIYPLKMIYVINPLFFTK